MFVQQFFVEYAVTLLLEAETLLLHPIRMQNVVVLQEFRSWTVAEFRIALQPR